MATPNLSGKQQSQAPPPPPWQGAITYDPADPNDALGNALLTGEWAGEDISMIRRVDDGDTHLWVMWRSNTIPVVKNS
jgi:hypothetical protein